MIHVSEPSLGQAEKRLMTSCLDKNLLTQGPMVERFEKDFAYRLGVDHAVACHSGTAALHLALAAHGIGPGDEVLVPDLTFVATANAVAYTGARPVLVDVDFRTWNISTGFLCDLKVSLRTKAIIPVHLYGNPCDMEAIRHFAQRHNLIVIEDAAEGLGGSLGYCNLGTLGHAGCFSFYGNKVLTTGEGGMVVTPDAQIAKRLRHLRGQAQTSQRYFHDECGFNYRMTDFAAALGVGQLEHLDEMLNRRDAIISQYNGRLQPPASVLQGFELHGQPVRAPWLYTIQVGSAVRDDLIARLAMYDIETRPTFVPLHRMPMYFRDERAFPNASRLGDGGICLPTHPNMTCAQVDYICDVFLKEVHR